VPQSVSLRTAQAAVIALAVACGSADKPSGIQPSTEGWWRDRTFYEVFVRSFADSDGDGVGDLRGLTAHLDDLNDGDPRTTTDLGVDAVWLMPIFASPSYHGYDVTDYRAIHPSYGTLEDFDAFVKAAHQRGIKVILDMVLNHTSSAHPWFVGSRAGPADARRDWYLWRATNPGWLSPFSGAPVWHALGGAYYYGLFWSGMPDLNLGNPAVEQELVDAMKFWLARGTDGFRLDAARHYFESAEGVLWDQPETHAFLRRIRLALQRDYPHTLLAAEAWATVDVVASYYGNGDEAQLAFSFDLAQAIKRSARDATSVEVVNTLVRAEASLAGKDRGFQAPFLSNHDQVRALRDMGGDGGTARLAAAMLLALPGTPFIYYGEEIGMQGGAGTSDPEKRTPFRWTATPPGYGFTTSTTTWFGSTGEAAGVDVASQRADPSSLWNLYRRLIALRRGQPALPGGDVTLPAVTGGGPGVLALLRAAAGHRILFAANFSGVPTGPFTVDVPGTPTTLLAEGLAGPPSAAGGKLSWPGLAARSFAFLSMN